MTLTDYFSRLTAGDYRREGDSSFLCLHTVPNQVSFPLQEENRPVGGFSLRGSLVSALEDNGVPTGKGQLWPWPDLGGLPPVLSVNTLLMKG